METKSAGRLGDILVGAGLITEDQLELALNEQAQTDEKLGAVLQRLGIVTEKAIARILASQAGVSHVSLGDEWIQREAVDLIPVEFAELQRVFPITIRGNTLVLAMSNPVDLEAIDEAGRLTGHYIEVVHATDSDIKDAITQYHGSRSDIDARIEKAIKEAKQAISDGTRQNEDDSIFVRLADLIIAKAVEERATDIHIEPEEKVVRCRYRIDGRLIQGHSLPKELQSIIITRFKILSGMNISESRVPQDGRILFKHEGRSLDLRVSSFPTVHGESFVSRLLDKGNLTVGINGMGMGKKMLTDFKQDISRPNGIILVTGPTGSGKTTTLYSALSHLNAPDVKMITLEDPVEYELPLINQGQIQAKQGFTFAKGLRAILRQDPDILLVGEIRDQETAQLAVRAALTGHLVFSTLHTNDAAGVIPRLTDMGVEPFMLSATLVAVVAQRLVRTVCPVCRVRQDPTAEQRAQLDLDAMNLKNPVFTIGKGCPSCNETGYKGRMAVFEYLRVSDAIRQLISDGAPASAIQAQATEDGMRGLRENTLAKVVRGKTSLAELLRAVS
jgi:type IV pilus assembly protein PilB